MVPDDVRLAALLAALVTGAGFVLGAVAVSKAGSFGGGLLFALPVVGALAWGAARALRAFTFGAAVLRLETRPGVIGGELSGTVETRLPRLEPGHRFKVRLSCKRLMPDGARKTLWHADYAVGGEAWRRRDGTVEIPCWFRIPRDLPESAIDPKPPCNLWLLEVTTTTIRGGYAARFAVPVVRARLMFTSAGGS